MNKLKKNAKACDKTVSAYIREVALNMSVITIDNTIVTEHINEISAYRNAVNQLVYTIRKTGSYVPADFEYILTKTNEILKSEKSFLQKYNSFIEKAKKEIRKTARNAVKDHLSPKTKSIEENNTTSL